MAARADVAVGRVAEEIGNAGWASQRSAAGFANRAVLRFSGEWHSARASFARKTSIFGETSWGNVVKNTDTHSVTCGCGRLWGPLLILLFVFPLSATALARSIDLGKSAWRRYPYRLRLVRSLPLASYQEVFVTDLDQNGVSEFLLYPSPESILRQGPLRITTYTLCGEQAQIIQEEPLRGVVYPGEVREANVLDDPGDELVIPYRKGNELRCHIWNYQTLARRDHLLYTRQPPDSAWDPTIRPMATVDADFDGNPEILFYLYTGYSLIPRGWILLDPQTGEVRQQAFFGGPPDMTWPCLTRDFDNDGHLEVVIGTNAPENHFELNGISDLWSYVLVYDLVTGKREFTRIMGPFYGGTVILGPGPTPDTWLTEYSGLSSNGTGHGSSRLSLFRWKSQVPVREVTLTGRFRSRLGPDYDGDGHGDIYCMLRDRKEFWVLSPSLKLLDKVRVQNLSKAPHPGPFRLEMADVNSDGDKELILLLDENTYILDHRLNPLAAVPRTRQRFCGLFNRGTGEPPFLVTTDWLRQNERSAYLWQMVPTPLFVRYGPSRKAIYAALSAFILGGVVVTFVALRRARLSNRLLHLSLESAGLQVVVVNDQGRVMFVWGQQFLPVQVGKRLRDACSHKSAAVLLRTIEEWQQSGHLARRQLSLPPARFTPSLTVDLEIAPRGRQVLLIIRASDQADRTFRQQWQAAAQRLAREIDVPLAVINEAISQQVPEETQNGQVAPNTVHQVHRHAQNLRAAVRRFIKLTNPSIRDLQPQDLQTFLKEWSEKRKATLPQGIELVVDVAGGLRPLVADADQLTEALDDLLENAVAAMPDGGLVRVSVRHEHAFRHGGEEEPRDYLVIEVKDSGKGIPAELLGKIFEPDFPGNSDGSGVSLFIVRRIVEDHGGFVDISSATGVGTIVSLYFPVENGPAQRGEPPRSA